MIYTRPRSIIIIIDIAIGLVIATTIIWLVVFVTDNVGRSLTRAATIEALSQIVPRVSIPRALFERVKIHLDTKHNIPLIQWPTVPDPFRAR